MPRLNRRRSTAAPLAWCPLLPAPAPPAFPAPSSLSPSSPSCKRSRRPRCTAQLDSEPQPEIELRNVNVAFDATPVLADFNFTLYRGQATAIIGPSGTGKSTALRVMSGLMMPDSGQVLLRGVQRKRSLAQGSDPTKDLIRIGMVFQNSALFDSLTVGENVAFALLEDDKLSDDRIYNLAQYWLKRVGLEGTINKYPYQLSGGMRKRVSLARALIHDPDPESLPNDAPAPDLLLYDEPTAGLDPTASTRIEDVISKMRAVCETCAVVTHQFSTIRRTVDRAVFMFGGRIVWDGPVAELDHTDNPYVRQFMTSSLEGPLSDES